MIQILFIITLISTVHSQTTSTKTPTIYDKKTTFNDFKCNIPGITQNFSVTVTPENAKCGRSIDGHIQIDHKNMTIMGITHNNSLYMPAISYQARYIKSQKGNDADYGETFTAIPGSKFTLSPGTYDLTIIYSYEFRDMSQLNGQNATNQQSESPTTESIEYKSCKHNVGQFQIGSKIGDVKFKPTVTHNARCSGNHGTVSCNADPEIIPGVDMDKIKLTLEGTEQVEGKWKAQFEGVAAGEYRCQLVTNEGCTFLSDVVVVKNREDCSPTQQWLDYQLYGEGKGYFYAGFIIGCVALLLNLLMIICSIKLCCSTEGSVEKLAEEYAAEYREKHGMEMH